MNLLCNVKVLWMINVLYGTMESRGNDMLRLLDTHWRLAWRYTRIKSNQPTRAVSLIARVAGREPRESAREETRDKPQANSRYIYVRKNLIGCHTTLNARLSGFLPIHNFSSHFKTPNYLTAWEPDSRADRVCQIGSSVCPTVAHPLTIKETR